MGAQSESDVRAYVPYAPSRLTVASDGTLAAVCEPSRVAIVELPSCVLRTEIPIDPDAEYSDLAWVSPPLRLVTLSRFASHSALRLIDPDGPRTVAEIRLEAPMRLVAAVGAHVLAVGAMGSAVLRGGEAHLTPYQFPARSMPVAAGSAAGQFVVALSASIEEWDPQARIPKRRLKLPGPTTITAVGGSDRVVWMTTQQDPTKIDVFALVSRGQPKRHHLPEPIAHVSGHPRSDLLVCRGAESNKLYIVDLDGKSALRTIDVPGIDSAQSAELVFGRSVCALVAQADRPMVMAGLGERDAEPSEALPTHSPAPRPSANGHSKRSTLYGDDEGEAPEEQDDEPADRPSQIAVPTPAPPTPQRAASLAERLSTWRVRTSLGSSAVVDVSSDHWVGQRLTWRDDLATWTRAVAAGELVPTCPTPPEIRAMLDRFALGPELVPAIALLYGSHLCGHVGAAPIDVARVLGRNWDEALGTGQLRVAGIARYDESRVRLAQCVERAFDGREPQLGTLVGPSGPVQVLGPCVVVGGGDDLSAVAESCRASAGGAILANDQLAVGADLLLEARAYGAVAMVRLAAFERMARVDDSPLIIVVPDEASAEVLGFPQLR